MVAGTGDEVTGLTLTSEGAALTADVNTYTVTALDDTITGSGLANYNITYTDGQLTVTKAALTIATRSDLTKVYGDVFTFGGDHYTVTGLKNADAVSGVTLASDGAAATAGVNGGAAYAVTALGATGSGLDNYTIAYQPGQLTVTPRSLTIGTQGTVAASKVYDGATAIEILTQGALDLAGLIGDDVVSLVLTAAYTDANAGESKDVIGAYALDGAAAGNYILADATFATTAAIEKAVLTYIANTASRVQGQANPAFDGAVTGFVADETLASATTGSLTWTSPATASSAPGSYAIDGVGLEAQNYTFVQAEANATALTVTAAPTTPVVPTAPWVPTVDEIKDLLADNPALEGKTDDEIEQIARQVVEEIVVIAQTPRVIEGGVNNAAQENAAGRVQTLVNETTPPPAPGSLTNEPASNGVDPENLRQFGPYIRLSSL
ncbi:MAG: YDG domain-containing protein [Opitutaceae bacterium]|nr:YDG domain-containing protein [Opitutaceae bacterium]